MKNKDKMIRDVHRRIYEYECEKKLKKAKQKRIIGGTFTLCAAAAVYTGLWADISSEPATEQPNRPSVDYPVTTISSEKPEPTDKQNTSYEKTSEKYTYETTAPPHEPVVFPICDRLGDAVIDGVKYFQFFPDNDIYTTDNYIGCGNDFEGYYNTAGIDAEFYTVKENPDVIAVMLSNGGKVYLKKEEYTEQPPQITLISSYPSYAEVSYVSPENGECGYDMSLSCAMEEYKNSVNYLVRVDVFSQSEQISDFDKLIAESQRLAGLGYISAVETVNDQIGSYSFMSLNATFEQLENFPAHTDYGYFLHLRDNDC